MGNYASATDLYAKWGLDNVQGWAQLDPDDEDEIDSRLDSAIEYAEAHLHNRLREGPYSVPLSVSSDSLLYVRDIIADIAGWWLYMGRGRRKSESVSDEMYMVRQDADTRISKLITGEIKLDAGRPWSTPSAPTVVS